MKMGWPQAIMIALWFLNIGFSARETPFKAWSAVISTIIMAGLLYWGGFF